MPGRLHALVIGVSSYPYGDTVPGPAVSAARFAEWLPSLRHPDFEYATMSVLLSPTEEEEPVVAEATPVKYEPATRDNVVREVALWAKRCNASPDDVGVLYLAGHGTAQVLDGSFLFLQGHGAEGGAMDNALDIGYLIEAMAQRAARTNLIFVDACRKTTVELSDTREAVGVRPVDVVKGAPMFRKTLKVFYGAAPEQLAWTTNAEDLLKHGTVFSKAFKKALASPAAAKLDDDGYVYVEANLLHAAMADLVVTVSHDYGDEFRGSTEGVGTLNDFAFHYPEQVNVEARIELDPAAAVNDLAVANLWRVGRNNSAVPLGPVPFDSNPETMIQPSGKYRIDVLSSQPSPPSFQGVSQEHWLLPSASHWRVRLEY